MRIKSILKKYTCQTGPSIFIKLTILIPIPVNWVFQTPTSREHRGHREHCTAWGLHCHLCFCLFHGISRKLGQKPFRMVWISLVSWPWRCECRNGSGFRVDFSGSNHWEIPQGDLDGENDDHELELELSGAPFLGQMICFIQLWAWLKNGMPQRHRNIGPQRSWNVIWNVFYGASVIFSHGSLSIFSIRIYSQPDDITFDFPFAHVCILQTGVLSWFIP
jgi:hypothetical protein